MGTLLRQSVARLGVISLALVIGLFPITGSAAPTIAVTEREFSDLLAQKVGEIEELKPLWKLARQNGIGLYLAGGGVRGLAYHLWKELSMKSLEEVRASRLPSFDGLFLSKSTDIDLVIETRLSEKQYRAALGPFGNWDLTERAKFEELSAIGGPHVEKMLLGPGTVIDPDGAVRDFVNGELRVKFISERNFYRAPVVRSQAITRMSQALRFARMHQEMAKLTVAPEQWDSLAAVIREDDLSGTLFPTEIRRDHRLFRELKKIFQNSGEDFVAAADLLRKSGALAILSEGGFYFPFDPNRYDPDKMDRKLKRLGWNLNDRASARRLIRNRTFPSAAWIRSLACRYLMTRDAPWNPVRGK